MGQVTSFGDAEVTTYIRVNKKDGTVQYYRVSGTDSGTMTPITEDEYNKEHQ